MEKLRAKYLNNLCNICEGIIGTLDLKEALQAIAKNAAKCLNAKASSIRLLDETGKMLNIAATHGLSKRYLEKGPVEVKKSLIDKEALRGKVVCIHDATKDKRFQYPKEARKEGIKSVLCVPLRSKDRTIGVLRVYTAKPHEFCQAEVSYLTTLAGQGTVVITNAQLHQRLQSIYELAKAITSHLELKKVLALIAEEAAQLMRVRGAAVMLLDRTTQELEVKAVYGLDEKLGKKAVIAADRFIKDPLHGKAVVIPDVSRDKRVKQPEQLKREGIPAVLCIPLSMAKKVIGVLCIYSSMPRQFSKEEIQFLTILADFGSVAIENAQLFEHIKRDYEDLTKEVWQWYDWGTHQPKL